MDVRTVQCPMSNVQSLSNLSRQVLAEFFQPVEESLERRDDFPRTDIGHWTLDFFISLTSIREVVLTN